MQTCPNCGYCPHCGRTNQYQTQTYPPPYPWTYISTYPYGTVTVSTQTISQAQPTGNPNHTDHIAGTY